jgi:hypothetical protein
MAHSKSEIRKAKNLLNKYAPKGEQLAYINSKEAKLLKSKGGAGKDVNVSGIKSYYRGGSPADSHNNESTSSGSSNNNNNSDDNSPQRQPASARSMMPSTPAPRQKSILDYSPTYQAVKFVFNTVKGVFEKQRGKRGLNPNLSPSIESANKTFNQMRTGGDYISDNGGNNTPPARNVGGRIIKLSPTTAEISQSSATDASPYDNRKTKAKGRSMMIQTSSRGINRNNTLTLGKPSLLGA